MLRASSVLVVVTGLSCATASADLVYQTQFQLTPDGRFLALALPDAAAQEVFIGEAFSLFSSLRVYNKRKFSEQELGERAQELASSGGSDGGGFGSVGDTVVFNPLATGGTVDMSTGGFISTDSEGQYIVVELASVGVENQVFRQEFGQVRVTRQAAAILDAGSAIGGERYLIEWGGGLPWESPLLATDANGLTGLLEVRMWVVPGPGTAGLLGLGYLAGVRRRRAL